MTSKKSLSLNNLPVKQDYCEWVQNFESSPKGKKALSEFQILKRKKDSDGEFEALKNFVLDHCYQAYMYDQDIVKEQFTVKRDYQKNLKKHADAIKAVKSFLKEYPLENLFALSRTNRSTDASSSSSVRSGILDSSSFSDFLDKYLSNLQESDVNISREVGPLFFPKVIDPNKHKMLSDLASHGLFFRLTMLIRHWTEHGEAWNLCDWKMKMPDYGRPNYKIGALFVDAALKDNSSSQDNLCNTFKKFLNKNPGLAIRNSQ